MTLQVWTTEQVLAQLIEGGSWSGSTITYSFPTTSASLETGGGEGAGFSPLTAGGQDAARLALQLWSDLITPDFSEVAAGSSATSTDIEFGMSTTGPSYAWAYFPGIGSVWLNSDYGAGSGTNNLVSPVIGDHGFISLMHEIGHALGLNHMGDYNGTGSAVTDGSSYQDSTVYSIMSYFGPSWGSGADNGEGLVAWADWTASDGVLYEPQTPMLNDILAIQTIYGASTTTRTGDTVYGFNSTITGTLASIYDFALNLHPILTLFDSAGIDTLDLSGFSTSCEIDLEPGSFSSCDGMTYNIAIAYNCDIENAVGGNLDDIILGNALGNALYGGSGSDTLYGGAGNDLIDGGDGNSDIAVFTGNHSDYVVSSNSDGSFTVTAKSGTGGSDTLRNVELLRFDDIDTSLNHTPTVNTPIANQPATQDSAFNFTFAADIFNDVDTGDTLVYTAVLDGDKALPSWLHFDAATRTFSGTPANGDVGTISVKVIATDGSGASISDTFNIVVANVNDAPTVAHALSDQSATSGTLFSFHVADSAFSDVDSGDTLTYSAVLSDGSTLPSWLHFDATTHSFSGTPTNADAGTISVKVIASDGVAFASDIFNLDVASVIVNHAPVAVDDTASMQESGELTFNLLANDTDADSDALQISGLSWDDSKLELTQNEDKTISVTYVGDDLGKGETAVIEIGYDISDGKLTDHGKLTITVHGESEIGDNSAPLLVKNFDDETAIAGTVFGFAFGTDFFSDPDGDTLTYSAMLQGGKPLPSWLVFDVENRSFSGTPGEGDVGTIAIVITASDGSLSASDTFELTIDSGTENVNTAPTDITLSKYSIAEDADPGTVIGKLTGVDPDAGDSLSFSLESNPDGLFDIVGGKLVLADGAKLDFETKNAYDITVRVTDSGGLSYTEAMSINVTDVLEPIVGNGKNNALRGTSGDDILMGLGGNDSLDGGKGADELDGGKGDDTATYANATAAVTASLLRPTLNKGEADGDSYISIENLTGSRFGDKLTGSRLDNTIDGGKGNDMLTGGAGGDLFIFGAHYGKDTIVDLVGKGRDHDIIDLADAAGITSYRDLVNNHLRDTGQDLQITTADGSKLILAGLDLHDISKADFLF